MICKAQEDGIIHLDTPMVHHIVDIYASVIRGAEWQPQGGGTFEGETPPEISIDTVKYGYINDAARYRC